MRTRSIIRFLCLAIVASFSSLSSAQQAVSFAVSESGFVPTTSEQKLKIAVLMPQVDNPLTVFANSIVNGIKAENSQQSSPYEIIPVAEKSGAKCPISLAGCRIDGRSSSDRTGEPR